MTRDCQKTGWQDVLKGVTDEVCAGGQNGWAGGVED